MRMHNFYHIFIFGLIFILFVKFSKGEEFKSNDSYILRYTEENQYLPNLIQLYKNFGVNFDIVKYSNGDILIEFLDDTQNAIRKFFGLKANGRYRYGDEKIMSEDSLISINDDEGYSGDSVISYIAKDENNYEYMISSISGYDFYLEIYDFAQKNKITQEYNEIFNLEKRKGIITFIEIKVSNVYYVIICGDFSNFIDDSQGYFNLIKINIQKEENPIINKISVSTEEIEVQENEYKGCYNIESEKIICFIYNTVMNVHIFNYELQRDKNLVLDFPNFDSRLFKCIHIKSDIGSIIYLTIEDVNNYLNIEFLNYIGEGLSTNYLPTIKYQIDYNEFNYNTNNFIKISENKICFIAQNASFINIYLIYLYEQEEVDSNKVVIREYNLNSLSLYNVNNKDKISSIIYNNYIALALNYIFPNNEDIIYGGLIIFGYANGTDYNLDLEEYIVNENNLNLEIDLKSFLKIENNFFGYEYSGSKIVDLVNCNNIQLYSSKNTNIKIVIDSRLQKDEAIKFNLEIKDYSPFECIIEYRFIVSEPDLETFNIYPNKFQNSESETNFNSIKGEYMGKQSSYKIILNNELTKTCENGCSFCQKTGEKKCLNNEENESEEEKKLRNYMNSINVTEVDSLVKNLELIINNADPYSSYLIKQKSFTLILNKLNEYNEKSTVNLDFTVCEKKLRENLPSDTILRIVQINIEPQNENILNEQVEYQVYDQNNKEIDLSVCNNIPITVENKITNISKLNMDKILELKNSGVDLFNIKDEFFNDICCPYSDNKTDSDMILSDRVNDLFQNFSVCGDGCEYNSFNETKMSVNCICKIKQEISEETEKGNFAESIKGVFLYSNFGIIKCYELFFSPKDKIKNIGFMVFTMIIIGHIPGYIFYFIGRIDPIKNYLKKEMKNAGYITKEKENHNNKDNNEDKKDLNLRNKKKKIAIK